MLSAKSDIVVGLTTFYNEMLRISVGALAKIRTKFTLIVFNDNPTTTITKRDIRALGYDGDVQIINSPINVGTMAARMDIIRVISGMKNRPTWTIFNDDDDIITNLDVPTVADENFAVVQNNIVLRGRVMDLFRAMDNPSEVIPDDENIVLTRPHIGFAGTLIRSDILVGMRVALLPIIEKITKIADDLNYRPPIDTIMWSFVNMYARHKNLNAVPIYMDRTNYISTQIDGAAVKYGRPAMPRRGGADAATRAIAQFESIFRAQLNAMAAAPVGQDL